MIESVFNKSRINPQKQPPEVFYKDCFLKFRNIYRKTPVLESLFSKVAGLKATIEFIEYLRWLLLRKGNSDLLKRDSNTGVFLCILRNFLEHLL